MDSQYGSPYEWARNGNTGFQRGGNTGFQMPGMGGFGGVFGGSGGMMGGAGGGLPRIQQQMQGIMGGQGGSGMAGGGGNTVFGGANVSPFGGGGQQMQQSMRPAAPNKMMGAGGQLQGPGGQPFNIQSILQLLQGMGGGNR